MAITKDILIIMAASRFNRAPRLGVLSVLIFNRLAEKSWGD
jgi:hypothetical protein